MGPALEQQYGHEFRLQLAEQFSLLVGPQLRELIRSKSFICGQICDEVHGLALLS